MFSPEFIKLAREAIQDPGYSGPPIRYLLCRPDGETNAEFIVRVTPDPEWSHQTWEKASAVSFHQLDTKHNWYDVTEITKTEHDLHLAFETLPIYDVDGKEMAGGD